MNLAELKAKLEEMQEYLDDTKVHLDPYDLKDDVNPDWIDHELVSNLADIERRVGKVVSQLGSVIHE